MSDTGSNILQWVIGDDTPNIVASSGVFLTDDRGRKIIDASGGAAVACLGHAHPQVIEAMRRQMEDVCYVHAGSFTTPVLEELASVIAENAPDCINHTYFVSGGSEAIETAIKLARQYHMEAGDRNRTQIIARRQSYHGNTLGALSASGHPARRKLYEPMLLPFHHVDPCFYYHHALPGESEEAYAIRAANALETKILELGHENVAAFLAETVVGATLGAATAEAGYFKRVRDICDQYGVLLILDEVMCGLGRTGSMHAFEQEDILPDLVTLAKGLAGGYQPIGAVLISDKVYDQLAEGSGVVQHGLTYSGHPVAAAAALAVQKVIMEDDLLANVTAMGARLHQGLKDQFAHHPHFGALRGRGLLMAIEWVEDPATKSPFDPKRQIHGKIKSAAMACGLMIYPNAGCIDGERGDHVLVAPPFNVTASEIDLIIERLGEAMASVF